MLDEITVNNFRNLKNIKIEPALITLLIGTNSSGKSGIFHSLLVLKQTFAQTTLAENFIFSGDLINLGSKKEVVFDHDESNDIEIGISATFDTGLPPYEKIPSEGLFLYKGISKQDTSGCDMILNIGKHFVCNIFGTRGHREMNAGYNDSQINFQVMNDFGLGFNGTIYDNNLNQYGKFFSTELVSQCLDKLFFVPVPRGIGEFRTPVLPTKARTIITSESTSELTKNLLSTLAYDVDLVDKVSAFMEKLFDKKIRHSLTPSGLGIPPNRASREGVFGTADFYDSQIRSYASNTGFGLNQVLFLFTQLLDCPTGSTILIEEPEISLHPTAQKELMNLLIDIAKSQQKQLIITTHSEHIAFALFKAKDKQVLKDDDLSIYLFTQEKESKQATIAKINTLHDSLRAFLGNDSELILQYIEAFGKKDEWLEKGNLN